MLHIVGAKYFCPIAQIGVVGSRGHVVIAWFPVSLSQFELWCDIVLLAPGPAANVVNLVGVPGGVCLGDPLTELQKQNFAPLHRLLL